MLDFDKSNSYQICLQFLNIYLDYCALRVTGVFTVSHLEQTKAAPSAMMEVRLSIKAEA